MFGRNWREITLVITIFYPRIHPQPFWSDMVWFQVKLQWIFKRCREHLTFSLMDVFQVKILIKSKSWSSWNRPLGKFCLTKRTTEKNRDLKITISNGPNNTMQTKPLPMALGNRYTVWVGVKEKLAMKGPCIVFPSPFSGCSCLCVTVNILCPVLPRGRIQIEGTWTSASKKNIYPDIKLFDERRTCAKFK